MFKGKNTAVLGLGLEGKDLVAFLLKEGAIVTVLDQKAKSEIDFSGVEREKISLRSGENYLDKGLTEFDFVFRSPGVYRYIPELSEAEDKGVVISSAIKLFFDLCPGKTVGVTGTKGKGTTSTLIHDILKKSGKDVYLAGNIGYPFLELLPKLKKESVVVLELSSFQLIDLTKSPNVAVVLDITVDHLNWHKDIKEYVDSKRSAVKFQKHRDYSIINADYPTPMSFVKDAGGKILYFSRIKKVDGCYVLGKKIISSSLGEIGNTEDLLLRGKHNLENVTAAICAASVLGTTNSQIKDAVFSFKGLEHRLELVRKVNGVSFYNDSFATGPQPTIAAIISFSEPMTVIMGGSDKGLNYAELGSVISRSRNVEAVILVGATAEKIKNALKGAQFDRKIIEMGKSPMQDIVNKAFSVTPEGGVVLLSPASASFDMFKDYKERGNLFRKVVQELSP